MIAVQCPYEFKKEAFKNPSKFKVSSINFVTFNPFTTGRDWDHYYCLLFITNTL